MTSRRFSAALVLAFATSAVADEKPAAVPLCGPSEPGEKVTFTGRILDYEGKPLAKAAVVAYNADKDGLYVPKGSPNRIPRIRGVGVTDDAGRFRFTTVKPGPYPNGSEPAHIHLTVAAPAHHVRHIAYWFEGDPLITAAKRAEAAKNPETVIVTLKKEAGVWTFTHDVKLEDN